MQSILRTAKRKQHHILNQSLDACLFKKAVQPSGEAHLSSPVFAKGFDIQYGCYESNQLQGILNHAGPLYFLICQSGDLIDLRPMSLKICK